MFAYIVFTLRSLLRLSFGQGWKRNEFLLVKRPDKEYYYWQVTETKTHLGIYKVVLSWGKETAIKYYLNI